MYEMIKKYVAEHESELFSLLKTLCSIPAPSHNEEKRAEFCKSWLIDAGAQGVYIDNALNVIYPLNCEGSDNISVFVAHTDTVFPDTAPMPFLDEGEIIRCPSICDDTASLAVLLMCAKYLTQNNVKPHGGILFVCNSCEEGLGNLKGTRQLFNDYQGRISQFISFDSLFPEIADKCVGSHRYEVKVTTEGGHSYLAFGKKNAIAVLASIIDKIYQIEIPQIDNSKTTYNVGIVSGGTSVNTIAQSASVLCEYRSDNVKCLSIMQEKFKDIFDDASTDEVQVTATLIGERPCMAEMDTSKIKKMYDICKNIIESVTDVKVHSVQSSTDCNIPLSLGIPAICVGVCDGGGRHTREEWLIKDSLPRGLEVGLNTIFSLVMEENK